MYPGQQAKGVCQRRQDKGFVSGSCMCILPFSRALKVTCAGACVAGMFARVLCCVIARCSGFILSYGFDDCRTFVSLTLSKQGFSGYAAPKINLNPVRKHVELEHVGYHQVLPLA
jgi:hypothetical protein